MDNILFKPDSIATPAAIVGGSSNDSIRFTVLSDGLIRLEWADDHHFEDRPSTFAINRNLPCPEFRLIDEKQCLEIITKRFHLRYDKKAFSPNGLTIQVKGTITDWQSKWRYGSKPDSQNFLGGTARTLDIADGRIPLEPGVIAKNGFSEIDDSQSMLFTDHGWFEGRRPGDRKDIYVFAYGRDYEEAVKMFYRVAGSQPLVPRWALGNWWSRYYEYSAKEYLELMNKFANEQVPLSVSIIDMDWHWIDKHQRVKESGSSGWTGYSWNTELFPDPKGFLEKLAEKSLKAALNDHPADGIACYEDVYQKVCERLGRDAKSQDPVVFDPNDKDFMEAYFDVVLHNLEKDGLQFWWIDWQQGRYSSVPGVDPLWVLNHLHFLRNAKGSNLPMIFSRYAGPGSHRYPVGFSGDTIVTWESLDFQPEFTASASNIGYGWWSHDIGGHMQGYRDDELVSRWVQYGVYSPILRLHSTKNPFNSKEPWCFSTEACEAMKLAMRFRHRLIPYLYSCNYLTALGGLPLIKPLYWTHPNEEEAYKHKNTYWFGTEMLVAPVTSRINPITKRARTDVWLPPGRWVDINSNIIYNGDREISMYRTLFDQIVLAKQGAIIPLDGSPNPGNRTKNPESLWLHVVVGAHGSFDMYEDDGEGISIDSIKSVKTAITFDQAKSLLRIEAAKGNLAAIPSKRNWKIAFYGCNTLEKSFICSHKFSQTFSNEQSLFYVCLEDIPTTDVIFVEITPNQAIITNCVGKNLFQILMEMQIDFSAKTKIWEILNKYKEPSTARWLSGLRALDLDPEVLGVVEELLLADDPVFIQPPETGIDKQTAFR